MLFWCLLPTSQTRRTNQPGSWCWLVTVIGPHSAGEISHGGGNDAVCGPVRPGLPVTQAGLVTTLLSAGAVSNRAELSPQHCTTPRRPPRPLGIADYIGPPSPLEKGNQLF